MKQEITFQQALITLFITGLMLTFGLWLWLFLFTMQDKREELNEKRLSFESDIVSVEERNVKYNQLYEKVEEYVNIQNELDSKVPVGFDGTIIAYFLQVGIGEFASNVRIDLSKEPLVFETAVIQPVSIVYKADIEQMGKIFEEIESHPFTARLSSMKLSMSKKEPEVTLTYEYLVKKPEGYLTDKDLRERVKKIRGND